MVFVMYKNTSMFLFHHKKKCIEIPFSSDQDRRHRVFKMCGHRFRAILCKFQEASLRNCNLLRNLWHTSRQLCASDNITMEKGILMHFFACGKGLFFFTRYRKFWKKASLSIYQHCFPESRLKKSFHSCGFASLFYYNIKGLWAALRCASGLVPCFWLVLLQIFFRFSAIFLWYEPVPWHYNLFGPTYTS